MNQYTLAFKQAVNRILTLAYGREPSLADIIEFTKQPLKYAYLDQQQRIEDDYLAGRFTDSVVYYDMQAKLYRTYLEPIHLTTDELQTRYERKYQKYMARKAKLTLKGLS
ncbi:hypothetical protein IMAU10237_02936 [Lactiplantibacillus plantarum]|nr:hypothetical protein [Lactiplantibacillus plantarum]